MKKILVAIILIVTGRLYAQQAPYPSSKFIKSIDWELDTKIQNGLGSDQWPMTWAADDNIYAAWGDGWGWNGELKPEGGIKGNKKRSIGNRYATKFIRRRPLGYRPWPGFWKARRTHRIR